MTRTTSNFVLGVAALAGTLSLVTFGASAQTTTTAPPPPKAATTTPAAKATTTAPKAATTTAKTPVVCKGKDETACKTESTCSWIIPKKVEANGKVDSPYCRRVAGVAKKAADKKAATAPATTAPATTTPPAPAKK